VLLDAGEDPNQSAADGVTGLLLSAYRHESFQHDFPLLTQVVADLEMVALLLAAGADPNKAETHGLTPLHTAVFVAHGHDLLGLGGPRGEPNDEAGAALTAKLLARGADPNLEIRDYLVPSPQGQDTRAGARYANISAILLASVFGKTKLVDLMVDSGRVDVARRLSNGSTPLISAARLNSLTGVQAFIRAGADVHAADSKGDTALHLVARGGAGTGPIAEALIEAGARVDAKNAAGRTPVDIATVEGAGAGPAAGPPRNRGAPVGVDPAVQAGGVQAGRGPEAGPVILQAAAGPQTGRASAANARRLGAPAAK
jgi:ankyrin repeat protein